MKPYILAQTNWKTLKEAQIELAVLPWGATEAHNYHLPYSTDTLQAERLAAKAAQIAWEKGAKLVVLPAIPFGVNTGQSDIFLDINLNPSTQQAILNDILQVLSRQQIEKFLILNSHGGNDFKPLLRELGLKFPQMFLAQANWFQAPEKEKFFDTPGDHAGEMETSLMLHLKPQWVLPRQHWGKGKEKKNKISAFAEKWVWTERKWSEITQDTGVGDPTAASAEKGKLFFEAISQKTAQLFFEICNADTNNLYE